MRRERKQANWSVVTQMRQDLGYTQQELGNRANVSQGYLSQVETGQTTDVSVSVAIGLANALHVPLGDLLLRAGLATDLASGRNPRADQLWQRYSALPSSLQRVVSSLISQLSRTTVLEDK